MTTKLQLFNLALIRVGHTELLTDDTDVVSQAGILCNAFYEATRDAVLRDFPWRFAKKRVALVEDATITVPDEWAYAYTLPTDCLKVRMLVTAGDRTPTVDTKIPYEIMLGYVDASTDTLVLFTDLEDAELIYTAGI